jgi:hypothetical protein
MQVEMMRLDTDMHIIVMMIATTASQPYRHLAFLLSLDLNE